MNRDLEVRHCRALLAVKEEGGVGAAARALGVAQSTLSETLLSLERLVGAPVVVRRAGHGAVLTAIAEVILPHARLVVSASEGALSSIEAYGLGAIRLGTVESISSFLLPAPLRAFRERWPHVDVRVAIGLCEDLRARLGRREIDAALTIECADAAEMDRPSQTQLRFVVARDHDLARKPVSRRQLEDRTLLLADHAGAFNALLSAWLRTHKLQSAGSIEGVKRGVHAGDIGVLPAYAVTEELTSGAFVQLKLDEPPPAVGLRVTTLSPALPGSPLESLLCHIAAAFPSPAAAIHQLSHQM